MDHFGIGSAIAGAVAIYLRASRGTGRTTSLIESVKDGDRVVFLSALEADRFKRMCKERGVEVDCIVVDPKEAHIIFTRGTSQGRTILDHSWVENFYSNAIEKAQKEIDYIEREASDYGIEHRKTKYHAREISKWF